MPRDGSKRALAMGDAFSGTPEGCPAGIYRRIGGKAKGKTGRRTRRVTEYAGIARKGRACAEVRRVQNTPARLPRHVALAIEEPRKTARR